MPWNPDIPSDVRTVHLGAFTSQHAERIVDALDAVGIHVWTKEPGFITRLWQPGIDVFVDRVRLEEARAITDAIIAPRS